jgi:hypothetical protein
VQLIPTFGGAIDTLLTDSGLRYREERISHFFTYIENQLSAIMKHQSEMKSDIDNKINTEEFYDLFLKSLKDITTCKDKDKIQYFANILIKYVTDEISFNNAEIMNDILSNQTLSEIMFIKSILNNEGTYKIHKIYDVYVIWDDLKSYIESNLILVQSSKDIPPQFSIDISQIYIGNKLQNNQLVNVENKTIGLHYTHQTENQQSNYPLNSEAIYYSITEFGNKYMNWTINESKQY